MHAALGKLYADFDEVLEYAEPPGAPRRRGELVSHGFKMKLSWPSTSTTCCCCSTSDNHCDPQAIEWPATPAEA